MFYLPVMIMIIFPQTIWCLSKDIQCMMSAFKYHDQEIIKQHLETKCRLCVKEQIYTDGPIKYTNVDLDNISCPGRNEAVSNYIQYAHNNFSVVKYFAAIPLTYEHSK